MIYYDSKGKIVEFNGVKTNLECANGEIYKINSQIAYKKYFSYGECKIKQAIFEFIKSINNPHIVKLLERYYLAEDVIDYDIFMYLVNFIERDISKYNNDHCKIELYTYEWVEEEYFDILEQTVDYLLDNLNELLRLADFFSMNYISLSDIKTANMVCNKSNIVLIDPDMYYFVDPKNGKFNLAIENRRYILMVMKTLCQKLTEYRNNSISNNIAELFESSIKSPQYGVSLLSKKLSGCRIPLDYVARTK